jgi:hypothetical protein
MRILELRAGFLPEAQPLSAALRELEPAHALERIDVSGQGLEEEAWDRVLAAILASDLIVVT